MTRKVAITAVMLLLLGASTALGGTVTYAGQQWHVFKGTGRLGQHWDPSHVSINGNLLIERISGGTAGGIGNPTPRTYGTYSVTFKMSPGAGKYAIMLIGKNHNEIDFAEDKVGDSSRSEMTATVHWGAGQMTHNKIAGNFTGWHTAGVVWAPGKATFTLDGKVWAVDTQHVPSVPMHLAIQTAAFGGGSPSELQVDSLHIG